MKAWYIVIIFLTSLQLSAQVTEFAPIGARWWYDQYEFSGPQNSYWVHESEKDTLIGGIEMRKVSRKRIFNDGTEYMAPPVFFYQDSLQVYIKDFYSDSLKYFFDFGAEIGDTILSYDYFSEIYEGYAASILDSIGNTIIGSTPVKTFHLHNKEFSDTYISLFANTFYEIAPFDLPFPTTGLADPPLGGTLRCYEDGDFGLLKFTDDVTCEFIVSVNDDTKEEGVIYPNPTANKIYLKSDFIQPDQIQITDLTGRKLIFHFQQEPHAVFSADISALLPGAYFVVIYAEQKIIGTQMIMKQ